MKGRSEVLKTTLKTLTLYVGICAAVIVIMFSQNLFTKTAQNVDNCAVKTAENLRAMSYAKVEDEDYKTNTPYVEFAAFFARDLDGDGYAERLDGTCKELTDDDVLYIDINVLTNGYLENGLITIDGSNFNYSTRLISDNVIDGTYLGNVKSIKLKDQVINGSQKRIEGNIAAYLKSNINNYSSKSTITLTGTHVAEDGTRTEIKESREITVDWYGSVGAEIYGTSIQKDLTEIEQTDSSIKLNLDVYVKEPVGKLILKENQIKAIIPQLNGFDPISVTSTGDFAYDSATRTLTSSKQTIVNSTGTITKNLSKLEEYNLEIEYPIDAYEVTADSVSISIPIETYYVAYNNPNEEFENPIKSEVAKDIISFTYSKPQGSVYDFRITVGQYVPSHKVGTNSISSKYAVLKDKPLSIYNGETEETTDDKYVVMWELMRGTEGEVSSVKMREGDMKNDQFLNNSEEFTSMLEYSKNIGIYFEGASATLGDDGFIKVYDDDTDELIQTFTRKNWGVYSERNPFKYSTGIEHIRVETSAAEKNNQFKVYNVKELDDKKLTDEIEKVDFDELAYIYSYLEGTANVTGEGESSMNKTGIADYINKISFAKISVSKSQISTLETINNYKINIETVSNYCYDADWKNGQFIVKVPSEIIAAEINDVTVNDPAIQIIGYDIYQNEGNYYIKVLTKNEKPSTYKITIDCNITPNPTTTASSNIFELYSYNELIGNYGKATADIYDANGNNKTDDIVDYNSTGIAYIPFTGLVTSQYLTNYDDKGSVTISPNYADVEKTQRTANVNVSVVNNYSNTVSEVKLLGEIPFEGNKYIINGSEIGSQFTTNMSNKGIQIPEELKNIVTVYYSENAEATKDLDVSSNGWTTTPSDWTKVRRYLIDFGDYSIPNNASYTFVYEISIPAGVEYNNISYSEHAIYYYTDTEEGKLYNKTEPSKLGIRIAKKYNFDLTKFKKGDNKKVGGATYKITQKDDDKFVKLLTTSDNGEGIAKGLYIGKNYLLQEVVSPNDYVLNNEVIEFCVTEDNLGNLVINVVSENKFKSDPIVNSKDKIVSAAVEDLPKYNLVVNKKSSTDEVLAGVKFKLKETDVIYKTDAEGKFTIEGLNPNETYTIVETRADGYYVDSREKEFKLTYGASGFEIVSEDSDIKNAQITSTGDRDITTVNVLFTNEKITTYEMKILKVEGGSKEVVPLSGAQFKIVSTDTNLTKEYKTDANGIVNITGLYASAEDKGITGEYTLSETKAPLGYANYAENIKFKTEKAESGELNIQIENKDNLNSLKDVSVEGNVITLTLQNKPLFKLTKLDVDSGKRLANVGIAIYEIDATGTHLGFAKDVNGNVIGQKNEDNIYVVYTNSEGEIKLPLAGGLYEAVEVEYLDGYAENKSKYIFRVADSKAEETEDIEEYVDNTTKVIDIYKIEDLVDLSIKSQTDTLSDYTVILHNDLDFNDENSYNDASGKSYGDLNGNGNVQSLKDELTEKQGAGFTPIGKWASYPFSGIFDGQSHTISNLHIKRNDGIPVGLFGDVKSAKIQNLTVTGEVEGASSLGTAGLVGMLDNEGTQTTQIINCHNKVKVKSSNYAGGIVGNNSGAVIIKDCSNEANISGDSRVGGLIGSGYGNTRAFNSYNTGDITGTSYGVGGIIGIDSGAKLINVYNDADVSSSRDSGVGGIIGQASSSTILNSYNTHDISGYSSVGGIIGSGSATLISDVYNVGAVTANGGDNAGGIVGNANCQTIANTYNTGVIKGIDYVGGIAGQTASQEISNTYNKGNVIGTGDYVGGIVGYTSGNIQNVYNIAEVQGTGDYVGGIVGRGNVVKSSYNTGNVIGSSSYVGGIAGNASQIMDAYNTGTITGSGYYVGGIVGLFNPSLILNVYNTANVSGGSLVGKIVGGLTAGIPEQAYPQVFANVAHNVYYLNTVQCTGSSITECGDSKTQEQMKSEKFFEGLNSNNVWQYNANAYPTILNIADTSYSMEIIFSNSLKRHIITTEVGVNSEGLRTGGTIDGEYNDEYEEANNIKYVETVVHKKDSTEQIQMIPSAGYKISSIQINGQEIETFTPDETGKVTIPEGYFEEMTEDKHIVVIYEKSISDIKVHHYLKGTGPESGNDPVVLAPDEYYTGKVGEDYTTLPRTDIENYELIKDAVGNYILPENAKGKYTEETQEITYYYETVPVTLTVHHYLDGTETKLADDEGPTKYDVGYEYTTSPSEEVLKSYELVSVDGKENDKLFKDTVVTYYYKLKEHVITTRVEIPEGQDEKGGAISGEGLKPYETVQHGENSVNEIIMTPDLGYRINKITINKYDGKELISSEDVLFTVKEDGTYELPKFENVVNDYEIVVQYVPDMGRVIVHHYIEGTETKIAPNEITQDKVGVVVNTKEVDTSKYSLVEDSARYVLVESPEQKDVTIEKQDKEVTYYYQAQYKITTDVIPYDEKQADGTTKSIRGGNISGEDEAPYEAVIKGKDSTKEIKIVPDKGFVITKVTINGEDYDFSKKLADDGTVTLDKFENMQEDKHIEVQFRRISNVIVQYILKEADGTTKLYSEDEIPGYVGKDYDTSRINITNYKASEDEEGNIVPSNKSGLMDVDTIYVKYYYEKIPAGITVKHIEKVYHKEIIDVIDPQTGEPKKEEKITYTAEAIDGVDDEFIPGYVGDNETTYRKVIEGYTSTSPIEPEEPQENVINAKQNEQEITVTYKEGDVIEIVYWYEKEYKITTDVKEHEEEIINKETGVIEKVLVKGGSISGELTDENTEPLERVLKGRDSTKEIVIKPDYGYRIKTVTLKDGNNESEAIDIQEFMQKDGKTAVIPTGYFENMQADKHIEVEFERIPANVIVKYLDALTKEELLDEKQIEGFVKDPYNEPRVNIEGYGAVDPEPTNSVGEMTEETITIIYYYQKQYKITTDVKEHEELKDKNIVDVVIDEDEFSKDKKDDKKEEEKKPDDKKEEKVWVKGGTITGELTDENKNPVEVVIRGKDSTKEIEMIPDEGYRIKSLTIYDGEKEIKVYIPTLLTDKGTIVIPAGYFENMQSDKHLVVEYEPIPARVIVNYFDKDTEEKIARQEIGNGNVNNDYKTYEKDIPYYELIKEELPENAEGKLTAEDTIVNYWYRKLLFNMKITKQFSSIKVNGQEVLGEDNKFAKIEISNTEIDKTNIVVKYKLFVTNTEKVPGIAKVVESIPYGFKFSNQTQGDWQENEGKYELMTRELQPGETIGYEVVLEWDTKAKCIGNLENIARIAGTENEPKYEETTLEDNKDSCMLILSIKTGENRDVKTIISISCFALAGVCTVVYVGTEIWRRRKIR